MKVKLLIGRAGSGISQSPGDIVEVTEAESGRMIAKGQCVLVETASKKAPETASGKGKKKK